MNKQERNRAKALRRSKRNSPRPKPVSDAEKARRERRAARNAAGAEAGTVLAKVLPLSRPAPSTVEGKEHADKEKRRKLLQVRTVEQLRYKAGGANIAGRSKMNKSQLIEALLEA